MMSLFLDTSSSFLTIGLLKDEKLIDSIDRRSHNDLSTYTVNDINELLLKNGVKPKDIEKIYCINGPGSFTGIRIGVTIAKTFAWLNNIKVYPISSLYAMSCTASKDLIAVPIIDARRGYVYAGIYKNKEVILNDCYIKLDDLIKKANEIDGIKVYISNDTFDNLSVLEYIPSINNVVDNLKNDSVDANLFVPNYLKKTEAEENLEKNDKRES